jgi:hypothetical protein
LRHRDGDRPFIKTLRVQTACTDAIDENSHGV